MSEAEGQPNLVETPKGGFAKVNVLLTDANRIGCELLANALREADFDVVSCATTSAEIFEALGTAVPHVALISIALQDGPYAGLNAIRRTHAEFPLVRIVALLDHHDHDLVVASFRTGAQGIFFRSESLALLCKCIRVVSSDQVWASNRELQVLLEALATMPAFRQNAGKAIQTLSTRERQLVSLVVQGLTNRDIARKMYLSESTVKNYLGRIFEKLGVSNRVELVLLCTEDQRTVA
jgi:DNA-binding NarL/FixJ family response regulator